MSLTILSSAPELASEGYVEFYGQAHAAGGWLFCGWCRDLWPSRRPEVNAFVRFLNAAPSARATFCFYPRPDLPANCLGLILFVPGIQRPTGELLSIDLEGENPDEGVRIVPIQPVAQLREPDLIARTTTLALRSYGSVSAIERINALLARKTYSGQDTLAKLTSPVACEVDAVIRLPDLGLAIIGWLVDAEQQIASLHLRCGGREGTLAAKHRITIPRPDVVEAIGQEYGFDDEACGFIWLVPMPVEPGTSPYLEIELHDGSIGHKPLPLPKLRGIAAIKHVLTHARPEPLRLDEAFRDVLVPAVQSLNRARLEAARDYDLCAFGAQPIAPACSVIVPLYGRIDFLEYQMAIFSAAPFRDAEFIYVLDDPSLRDRTLELARSVFARFEIPFRLVLLKQNWGYAPANNIGLSLATGIYTCFLNSDVIPQTQDWLPRLCDRLKADPGVGIVGALLQFEDNTIQHAGMTFERLDEFGGWPFPHHPGKGRRPTSEHSRYFEVEAVTGACMVIRTELARSLGGFDEIYAIGDFEDSDLCMKVRATGARCMVDGSVRLWHLERQSQATAGTSWRMNLTLANAWIHKRRWFEKGEDSALASPDLAQDGKRLAAVPAHTRSDAS